MNGCRTHGICVDTIYVDCLLNSSVFPSLRTRIPKKYIQLIPPKRKLPPLFWGATNVQPLKKKKNEVNEEDKERKEEDQKEKRKKQKKKKKK